MTKKELKTALLNNQVRNYDGEVIPATLLTNNMMLENSIMNELWKLYEADEIYVGDDPRGGM